MLCNIKYEYLREKHSQNDEKQVLVVNIFIETMKGIYLEICMYNIVSPIITQ